MLGSVFGGGLSDVETSNGGTARAERILAAAGIDAPASESVLVQTRAAKVDGPALERTVRAVRSSLERRPEIAKMQAPVTSRDGRSVLLEFDLKGASGDADSHVAPVLAAVANLQRGHPGYRVEEFGGASADRALSDTIDKDFAQAERLSVPLTFIILLFAFGAFVAAGLPVLLALSAVMGSVGVSALASHVFHRPSRRRQ